MRHDSFICAMTHSYVALYYVQMWLGIQRRGSSQPALLAVSIPFSFTGTSVLQCIAVCCSVWQCVAVRCSVIAASLCLWPHAHSILIHRYECAEVCDAVLQCVTECAEVCDAVCCSALQCVAVCCSVLQCVAVAACTFHRKHPIRIHRYTCIKVCCSALQCVAVCVATTVVECMRVSLFLSMSLPTFLQCVAV